MDFKARNPNFSYWSNLKLSCPFPYEDGGLGVSQFDAPDNSTKFLSLAIIMSEDEASAKIYLIEAPLGCPMRREFEFGELTWLEFWHHKNWLIELRISMKIGEGDSGHVRYIHPSQMCTQVKEDLLWKNNISPMVGCLRNLEGLQKITLLPAKQRRLYAKRLKEFREKYPEITSERNIVRKCA